jgi:hypothetical protein
MHSFILTSPLMTLLATAVGLSPSGVPAISGTQNPTPVPVAPPPASASPYTDNSSPFRLGLTYTHVFAQDGDLTAGRPSTNAIGIDMAFPSNTYGRNHLGLAHQWESTPAGTPAGTKTARGFRIDLISIGYPIQLVKSKDHFYLEPILTVLRGEIMFETGGRKFLRLESGFALELAATIRGWFVSVQPLAIDFRYWIYSSTEPASQTGFGRIFPIRIAVGREF